MIADKYIEHVARAMCIEDNKNPDDMVPRFNDPDRELDLGDCWGGKDHEQWREYQTMARRHLAAYLAIQIILPKLGR